MSANLKTSIAPFLSHYHGLRQERLGGAAIDYTRLSIDTRTLRAGDLFVALRGENHDGHRFTQMALEKGAAAAVVSQTWAEVSGLPDAAPLIVVADPLDFLQQLAAWHRRQFDLPVIGVTGSNGKTTTREMIATVLAKKFRVFRSSGNKNNHIGLPLMLLQITEKHEVAVIEMGTNHPGEIAHLARLTGPTAGVITNIGKGHLGFFGSLEAIYREKTALFDAVPPDGTLFVNAADPYLRNYPVGDRRAVTVGPDPSCDVWGRAEAADELGRFRFRLNGETPVQLAIPGAHNVLNALLAAAVGRAFGVPDSAIRAALEKFSPAEQRMAFFQRNGILFINDAYNANPDSMRAAVAYLAGLERPGKHILVLGDMLELGEYAAREHRELGEFVAQHALTGVITYGELGRLIKEGVDKAAQGKIPTHWYGSHREIAAHLQDILAPGDVILLKGSRGMTLEKILDYLPFE